MFQWKKGLLLLVLLCSQNAFAQEEITYEPGRIALVQFLADEFFGEKDRLRETMTRSFDYAVARGAKFVAFAEGATTGYASIPDPDVTNWDRNRAWASPSKIAQNDPLTYEYSLVDMLNPKVDKPGFTTTPAEQIPGGSTTQYWAQKAIQHGVYIIVPTFELFYHSSGEPQFASTAILLGPSGYIGKHRKSKIWKEDALFISDRNSEAVGRGPSFIQTPFGIFGVEICNGIFCERFQEEYVRNRAHGAVLVTRWVPEDFRGFQGPSADNSLMGIARQKNVNLLVADQERRTAVLVAEANSPTEERVLADGMGNAIFFVDFQALDNEKGPLLLIKNTASVLLDKTGRPLVRPVDRLSGSGLRQCRVVFAQ